MKTFTIPRQFKGILFPVILSIVSLTGCQTATNTCFTTWDKSNTGVANNKKVKLVVHFEQSPEGIYIKTMSSAGIAILQKKVLGVFWVNATANYIRITGQYSGPRSPFNNMTSLSGYQQPNPYTVNYSGSAITHFIDYSYNYQPCYTMDKGTYTVYADFEGGGVSTTVTW